MPAFLDKFLKTPGHNQFKPEGGRVFSVSPDFLPVICNPGFNPLFYFYFPILNVSWNG